MKKIMFAIVAIALSVVASASTVTWGAANAAAIDATKITAGTFYLMYSSTEFDASKFENQTSFSVATLAAAGLDKTLDSFEYSSSTYNKKNNALTPASTGIAAGNGLKVYEVLISSDGSYIAYGATTINLAAAQGLNQAKTLASSALTYVAKSEGGVPEPTSGLLLLIGGAMLALRRKQK